MTPGLKKDEWTVRDELAARALQGQLSNPTITEHPAFDREGLVKECYQIADAMLSERERGNK